MPALTVTALLRSSDPQRRATIAGRRLTSVVSEWEQGAALVVRMQSKRGRVTVSYEPAGSADTNWESDVRWALDGLATLTRRSNAPTAPSGSTVALEVRADRRISPPPFQDISEPGRGGIAERVVYIDSADERRRTLHPWPEAWSSDLTEVIDVLAGRSDLSITTVIGPASAIEADMVRDDLTATWTGLDARLHEYLGTIMRVRTVLRSDSRGLPAALRSLVRRWGGALALEPMSGAEVAMLDENPVAILDGHAAPEGLAGVLLRLPAAGDRPPRGMSSARPILRDVPLDPVPKTPPRAIRLGWASGADGRRRPVLIGAADTVRHLAVEGASGSGKSTFLTALVRGLIEAECGVTLLDPHGATVDAVLGCLPAGSAPRVTVVRHGDAANPVPLDILGGNRGASQRRIETFAEMVQAMFDPRSEGIVGPRWRRWFSLVAEAVLTHFGDDASLIHVAAIASDMKRVGRLAERIRFQAPELSHRLIAEYVNLADKEAADMTSWGASKFHPLLASDLMRATLGTGRDAVDVARVMDGGGALLVDLASPGVGAGSARMLGALWLLKHLDALSSRRDHDRPHVIVVDEAHLFSYGALPQILAEGRKFGVSVAAATQSLASLTPTLLDALESNAGSTITFRSGLQSARRASSRLDGWEAGLLARLPDLTAAASLSLDGVPTDPFTLHVDHHDRSRKKGWAAAARPEAVEAERHSRSRLVDPFTGLVPPSDAEILRSLQSDFDADREQAMRARRESRQAAQAAAGDELARGHDAPTSAGSAIDGWLAERARQRAADAAADRPVTPVPSRPGDAP